MTADGFTIAERAESGVIVHDAGACTTGQVVVRCDGAEGASGSGLLATLVFRSLGEGSTPLTIAEGHRPGNFKPSPPTVAAFHRVLRAAGVTPPAPQPRRSERKRY